MNCHSFCSNLIIDMNKIEISLQDLEMNVFRNEMKKKSLKKRRLLWTTSSM